MAHAVEGFWQILSWAIKRQASVSCFSERLLLALTSAAGNAATFSGTSALDRWPLPSTRSLDPNHCTTTGITVSRTIVQWVSAASWLYRKHSKQHSYELWKWVQKQSLLWMSLTQKPLRAMALKRAPSCLQPTQKQEDAKLRWQVNPLRSNVGVSVVILFSREADSSGDGNLDIHELHTLLQKLGYSPTLQTTIEAAQENSISCAQDVRVKLEHPLWMLSDLEGRNSDYNLAWSSPNRIKHFRFASESLTVCWITSVVSFAPAKSAKSWIDPELSSHRLENPESLIRLIVMKGASEPVCNSVSIASLPWHQFRQMSHWSSWIWHAPFCPQANGTQKCEAIARNSAWRNSYSDDHALSLLDSQDAWWRSQMLECHAGTLACLDSVLMNCWSCVCVLLC